MANGEATGGSRIIGRILPAAVRLWLRSQVEQVENLSLQIAGRDRDILTGYVPSIAISAQNAIYQGIHISQLQLSAKDIRINVGQVIRGKALRLLQIFPITGEVRLSAADLNASLSSALLTQGLKEFWQQLIQHPAFAQAVKDRYGPLPLHPDMRLQDAQLRIADQCLGLSFYPRSQGQTAEQPVVLGTDLAIVSGHLLQLTSPHWLENLASLGDLSQATPIDSLQGFQWDLGEDTQLTKLALQRDQLLCHAQVMVNP